MSSSQSILSSPPFKIIPYLIKKIRSLFKIVHFPMLPFSPLFFPTALTSSNILLFYTYFVYCLILHQNIIPVKIDFFVHVI